MYVSVVSVPLLEYPTTVIFIFTSETIMGILSKVIKCNRAIITSWQQLQGGIKIQESYTAYDTKRKEGTDLRKTKIHDTKMLQHKKFKYNEVP